MTRDEFWKIVAEHVSKRRGKVELRTAALHGRLKSLPVNDIEDFARHNADLLNEANTNAVLEAANLIGCGRSNDGFMDFRRWIVFQGKAKFEKIVNNPDYLGSYDQKADPIEDWY